MRRKFEHVRNDRCNGGAHDGIGGDRWNAKFHGDGCERQRGQRSDLGSVVRDGERVRIAFGNNERFGRCDHVYGTERGAESGDGDADGDVGDGWDEVGVGDDHNHVGHATDRSRGDDYAEGDGIGAESVVGTDGNRDE